jgi:hypothetical protein
MACISEVILRRVRVHVQTIKKKILALDMVALAAFMRIAWQLEWNHWGLPGRNNLWAVSTVSIESMTVYSRRTSTFGFGKPSSQFWFSCGLGDLTHHRRICAWVWDRLCPQVSSSASCPHMQSPTKNLPMRRDNSVWRLASSAPTDPVPASRRMGGKSRRRQGPVRSWATQEEAAVLVQPGRSPRLVPRRWNRLPSCSPDWLLQLVYVSSLLKQGRRQCQMNLEAEPRVFRIAQYFRYP